MSEKQVLIWGAGKIGRGFVADFFYEAGYKITFIDSSSELVKKLNESGVYTLVRADSTGYRRDTQVDGFSALDTSQNEAICAQIAVVDTVCISVYPKYLPEIAHQLVPCVVKRMQKYPDRPLDVILCTNLFGAGQKFKEQIEDELPSGIDGARFRSYLGVVDSIVIRLVATPPQQIQEKDPLLVWTNGVADFPVDRQAFVGQLPDVQGLRPIADMKREQVRKLYTYNMFHAVLSYFGDMKGYKQIVECLQDSELRQMGLDALRESSLALQAEYGFTEEEMEVWCRNVLNQTNDPILGDTVERYAGDPERKLRRDDRLMGPILLSRKHQLDCPRLVSTIAAALVYDNPNDAGSVRVQKKIRTLGLSAALTELCELSGDESDLYQQIVARYHQLKEKIV